MIDRILEAWAKREKPPHERIQAEMEALVAAMPTITYEPHEDGERGGSPETVSGAQAGMTLQPRRTPHDE